MNTGYIKVPRQMLSLPIWDNPWDVTLWLYCALRVSHRRYGSVQPGQFISSKMKMAQDLNWSRNGLKEHLNSLQEKGCIDVTTSDKGVRITLKDWKPIANGERGHEALTMRSAHDNGAGQPMTTGGHATTSCGQQLTVTWSQHDHIQEDIQTQDNPLSLRVRDFERWWRAYPRHEGKAAARSAYLLLDVSADMLLIALQNAKNSRQWLSSDGRYIPKAAMWLDGAWQDYVPTEMLQDREENPIWTTY